MYIQAVLTLSGDAQSLAEAEGVVPMSDLRDTTKEATAVGNLLCREVHIQPVGTNNSPVKFGDKNLTSSLFSFQLPAGDDGDNPPPPMVMGPYSGACINLGDIYALGAENESVTIGVVL